jgi:hypothetical protein
MVRNATQCEVSLVAKGACRPAYCKLVDRDATLEEDAKGLRVLTDGAAEAFTKALREARTALRH